MFAIYHSWFMTDPSVKQDHYVIMAARYAIETISNNIKNEYKISQFQIVLLAWSHVFRNCQYLEVRNNLGFTVLSYVVIMRVVKWIVVPSSSTTDGSLQSLCERLQTLHGGYHLGWFALCLLEYPILMGFRWFSAPPEVSSLYDLVTWICNNGSFTIFMTCSGGITCA